MHQTQDIPQKKWWQLKLRGKFIVIISLVLVLLFSIMAFFLVKNARQSLTTNVNDETKAFSSLATKPIGDNFKTYHDSGTLLVQQQMQKFAKLDPNISDIAVVNLEGLSQFSLTGKPINVSTQAVSSFDSTAQTNAKGQITLVVEPYIDDSGQHSYSIAYQVSTDQLEHSIAREELTILILMLLSLLISGLVTYEFVNYFFLQPINQITKSASIVAAGDYSGILQMVRYDEIGTLSNSINNMANALKGDISKLQELDKQKDEFIKIVSHNLRTPLTVIQGNLSFLEDAGLDSKLQKMVQNIGDSARRLNLFSEQILAITDFEASQSRAPLRQEATLNEVLNPLIKEFSRLAESKHIEFQPVIKDANTKFFTSPHLAAQAIRNILDNSFKFTSEGGSVELHAEPLADRAIIRIKDSGIGIMPEEMPKLFTKFHRASGMLVYDYEGTGIGLYVTKLLIERLGGKVHAQSEYGKGSIFTVELPMLKSDQA